MYEGMTNTQTFLCEFIRWINNTLHLIFSLDGAPQPNWAPVVGVL